MTALRIVLALDDSLDRPDGVQQHVLTLGRWLGAQGHDVHFLTPSTTRTDLPGLHILGETRSVRANGNTLGTPRLIRTPALDAMLDSLRPDVLHVALPCSPLLMGRLAARASDTTAVVGTFHILPANPLMAAGAAALGLVQRRQLRRFDAFTAVSAPAAGFARRTFHVDSAVVANPVDVAAFARADPERLRQPGPVQVTFLGRLVERKGPMQLLRAVAAIRREHWTRTPFRVVIAGDGVLAADLARMIAEHDLGDVVELVGRVAESDKADLLAAADIVVLPSTGGESFGISVVEALAAAQGLVLVGDNPGYRAVVGDLTDRLVPAHDPAALGRALAEAIEDPDRRASAREAQLARARKFDVERIGPQMSEVYLRALSSRRHTATRVATQQTSHTPDQRTLGRAPLAGRAPRPTAPVISPPVAVAGTPRFLPWYSKLELAAGETTITQALRWVDGCLSSAEVPTRRREPVRQAASELVRSAVRCTGLGQVIRVEIDMVGAVARVSSTVPTPAQAHGAELLAVLHPAVDWGTTVLGSGSRQTWCTLEIA